MSEPAAGETFSLGDRVTRSGLSPDAILDRFVDWLAESGIEPYPAQEEAFLELMAGRHVVLDTPTGSGKSLVAVLLHFKALCEGKRSFYTAPTKALASEKFFALCTEFGPENVGMLTGDASINVDAPIVCCTAEVLANIALRRGARAQIPYVCMDEFHFYGDRERGFAWQAPLLTLPETTFLLMSATLGDMSAIRADLERRTGRAVALVHSSVRPVPLDFRYVESPLHETVEELLEARLSPVYVVSFTQRDAAELAGALCSARVADRELREAIREGIGDFRFDSPYGKDMKRILAHGIGLHHAGLLPKYRLLVEQLAQAGLLRVISGTDTLGVGVNIPIRTVLFTGLAKFDGRKQVLLGVRDFKQIAGRAGRKGFDDRGSVVCQAPEHVIEMRRAQKKGGKKKPPPQRGRGPGGREEVSWNRQTFERLIERPPETLVSRFRITHDVAVNVLRREQDAQPPRCAYLGIADLIRTSHESESRRRRLLREGAVVFRSLRHGGIVGLVARPGRAGRDVRVADELQWNFSLLHNLSLYLVDALSCLDPHADDYALDVLSLVEAILDDPRALLRAQVDRLKRDLVGQLKAEGVPYEERMRLLDEVVHPQPGAELVRETFEIFRAHHPWVRSDDVRPKGIAREVFESWASFDGFVIAYGLQRFEGVLLRYLGQVYTTLVQSIPASAKNEDVEEMQAFFRVLIEQTDSSLVQEWENLVHPGAARARPEKERRYDLALDERGLRARLRAESHRLVHALSLKDWDEAARCVHADPRDPWDAARLRAALEPFFAEHASLRFDHRARQSEFTLIRRRGPREWSVTQRLLDPQEQSDWYFEAEVDLRGVSEPEGPVLRLTRLAV